MSETMNLIIDGLLNLTGSFELFGFVIMFFMFVSFLILRLPIMASTVLILPLGYIFATSGWIPLWSLAIMLLMGGYVLHYIISRLIK